MSNAGYTRLVSNAKEEQQQMNRRPAHAAAMAVSFLLALVLAAPFQAAPAAAGADIGAAIPHTLAAADQHGKARDFRSLTFGRGLVILFSRSLDW